MSAPVFVSECFTREIVIVCRLAFAALQLALRDHISLSVRIKPGILGFEDTFVGQVINKKLTLYLYALHHIPLMHE